MRFPTFALLLILALWVPCSVVAQFDDDQDGFFTPDDCDDTNSDIHPGTDDFACDGIDTDCDGTIETWYRDADGDGAGTNSNVLFTCTQPLGYVAIGNDCDDDNALRFPGAPDPCDGFDADCDGNGERWYTDLDGDGFGVLSTEVIACAQPPNTVILTGDCNDNEPSVFPGSPELCSDGLDNDCNGTIDDQTTWYEDADGDGYGTSASTLLACEQPIGYSPNPGDCDDANNGVYPLAGPGIGCASCSLADQQYIQEQYSEIWNITGLTIADVTPGLTGQAAWNQLVSGLQPFLSAISPSCRQCVVERAYCAYLSCATACVPWQMIGTGGIYPGTPTCNQCVALGGCNVAFNACVGVIDQDGDGYLSTNDCNDLNPAVNLGATELCDGIDNDCDGILDNFPPVFADTDGDGYGDPNAPVMCATPGSVPNNSDCDDTDGAIHPNAAELIDGIDNDCDGQVDEFQCNDIDGDGTTDCQGDCNDNEPSVFPGAAELCGDGLDNDCNGTIDDPTTWYEDADGDGFGTSASTLLACEQPTGYTPNPGDCDDTNNGVYPLAGPGIGCASCSLADQQYIQEQYSEIWNITGLTIADVTPGLTGQAAWNQLVSGLQPFLSAISPSCRQCVVERAYCAYLSCATACVPWQLIGTGRIYPGTPTCNQCVALGGCNVAFNACVGVIDQDGDGYLSTNDCDDLDAAINLGADELCDGVDNDCNGLVDDNFPPVFADADGDGFGNPLQPLPCDTPGVANSQDCDDNDPDVFPGSTTGFNCIGCSAADQVDMSQNLRVSNGSLTGPYMNAIITCAIGCNGAGDPAAAEACFQACFQTAIPVGPSCGECLGIYIQTVFASGCSGPCKAAALADFQNCTGLIDADGDGYFAPADCSDQDTAVNPGAPEICDGIDNDCDGFIDNINAYADADGDGFGDLSTPVACGTPGSVANSNDCDDTDANVNPAAIEVCDQIDNDCDGTVDDGLGLFADSDGDGYGDPLQPLACDAVGVANSLDCDDTDALIFPEQGCAGCGLASQTALSQNLRVVNGTLNGPYILTAAQCFNTCNDPLDPVASEACFDACLVTELGIGASCSQCLKDYIGVVFATECNATCRANALDEFIACTALADDDNDGHFAPTDCNDQDASTFPGAQEVCDGADNDCDGIVDEAGGLFADNDGDGFGDPNVILACGVAGVTNGLDCNDFHAQQFPGGPVPCPDCTPADQALILSDPDYFVSASACLPGCLGQGGNFTNCLSICLEGSGLGADCADCVASYLVCIYSTCTPCLINPNSAACLQCRADSPCNTAYENCTGLIDNDNDGAYVFEDCDDTNASIYVNAPELCDGLDNDCDGQVDEGAPALNGFVDADGDGWGNDALPVSGCPLPPGSVPFGGDCEDADPTVFPFNLDDCVQADGIDNDCDGLIDNGNDLDADGFSACEGDCDDANGNVHPGAPELCDGIDNDCDGQVDEGCDVELEVLVLLEGPYDAATGLMNDGMRALGLVPATEPYSGLGYAHVGGGGETTTPDVLAEGGADAIVDWVLLELRDPTDPATIVATRSALVQRDGDVVDVDGSSLVAFTVVPGNYHVAVLHRNHLGCMTAGPVALSPTAASVDFTSNALSTFGTNARKSVGGAVSVAVLWAGDVTFNGQVKYTGSGNDRDPILTTVGSTTPNNTVSVYSTRDVNLNGQVKYTGSGNDRDPILVNVGSTTPNNVRTQQLP